MSASTVTRRRAPQCAQCKRPRLGHPRSGCPSIVFLSKEGMEDKQTVHKAVRSTAEPLAPSTHSHSSINEVGRLGATVAAQLAAISNQNCLLEPTPVSTASSHFCNLQEITEQVLQLGISDSLLAPTNFKVTGVPAGAAPPPDSSINILSEQQKTQPTTFGLPCSDTSPAILPLHPRSPSMGRSECETFITDLAGSSIAAIYTLPSSKIQDACVSTSNLGLHVRIIPDAYRDGSYELLVVGQDKKVVEYLCKKVGVEENAPSGSMRTAAAIGAMVGVIGAWASLAFV